MIFSIKEFFSNAKDLRAAIEHLVEENADFKHQVEDFMKQRVQQLKQHLIEKAEDISGVRVVKGVIPTDIDAANVKDLAFQIAGQLPEGTLCVIGSHSDNKPLLTVMLSKDLIAARGLNAGQMVREAAKCIKGGGGGAPHFATAGGKDVNGLEQVVAKVVELAGL